MAIPTWVILGKTAVTKWLSDYAPSMGAALAYYTVFSIAPLLVIVIAIGALVFSQDVAQNAIMDQARNLIGDNGAKAIESMLASAQKPKQGTIASVLGILALVIGATSVLAELEANLNRIWGVEAAKLSGLWHFIRARLLSLGMILAVGFLLVVSLVMSAAIAALGKYWGGWIGGADILLEAVNFVVAVGVSTALFALIYKYMPRATVLWRDVWVGALVTSLLFSVGKLLIGIYLGKAGIESAYGAAGALVILLVWVYYSAQIFLLGAEFTKVYADRHTSSQRLVASQETSTDRRMGAEVHGTTHDWH